MPAKILQIQFNPQAINSHSLAVLSLCPNHKALKTLGQLFLIGQTKNVLQQGKVYNDFFNDLAEIISQSYYRNKQKSTEQSLENVLVEANLFLSEKSPEQFHFCLLLLLPDNSLRISQSGQIKIILAKNEQAFSIGQTELQTNLVEKSFLSNLISGQAEKGDKVILFTPLLFDIFNKLNIMPAVPLLLNPKDARLFFKIKEKTLEMAWGCCLTLFIGKPKKKREREKI